MAWWGLAWRNERKLGARSVSSATSLCFRIAHGPVFRGEAYAPKTRIGFCKFHGCVKFFWADRCNQFYRTFDLFGRANVLHADNLALIQRGAGFHERAMRVYNDGVSLFTEGSLIANFPFNDHSHLKKQSLAASSACGSFHRFQPRMIPIVFVSPVRAILRHICIQSEELSLRPVR